VTFYFQVPFKIVVFLDAAYIHRTCSFATQSFRNDPDGMNAHFLGSVIFLHVKYPISVSIA